MTLGTNELIQELNTVLRDLSLREIGVVVDAISEAKDPDDFARILGDRACFNSSVDRIVPILKKAQRSH